MRLAIIGISLLLTLAFAWRYWATPPPPSRATVPPDLPSGPFVTVRYEEGIEDPNSNLTSSPVEFRIVFYPGLFLLQAVAQAGGLPIQSKMKNLHLLRAEQTTALDLRQLNPDGSNHPLLQAGDLILIPGRCPTSNPEPGK